MMPSTDKPATTPITKVVHAMTAGMVTQFVPSSFTEAYTIASRISAVVMVSILLLLVPSVAAAQTYTVMPSPYQMAMTNAGAIINNACIWTYSPGTLNVIDTYADSAGTLNSNPIRSDSAGRFTAYLTPGQSYKFVYETACTPPAHGTTLVTRDNVAAVPVSGLNVDITGTAGETLAAGDVVYLSDGTSGSAGQWYKADADNTYTSTTTGTVGLAVTAINSGSTGSIRTVGRITGLVGLTTGELYYVSATAGALTATPPTNARFVGHADSTTSLIVEGNPGADCLPDSDGTHKLCQRTSSNLTADRLLTFVTGDIAQTVTLTRPQAPGGRCTLTTGTAVTTGDVTAATTLFYTPYARAANPNQIALYDGSAWSAFALTELSIAVPSTTSTMYDVFVYNNGGTPTLELTAWTNDTTRATALVLQNGAYVKTGATTRLYVCSFRTTGSSGQTEDSFAKRYVWNYYNRVPRLMRVLEATDSWTYTTATIRQANGSTANQLDFIVGVAEVALNARVNAAAKNTSAGVDITIGIGVDSTTAYTTGTLTGPQSTLVVSQVQALSATLFTYPAVGRHFAAWLEYSAASGTTTWFGDAGSPTLFQTGISGDIDG